jgi:hypothetical protein
MRLFFRFEYFTLCILFIFSVLSIGCATIHPNHDKQVKQLTLCNPILRTGKVLKEIPTDFVNVESLKIQGTCLSVEISYGGGCGDYVLDLFYQETVQLNGTTEVILKPVFKDNDPCRAIELDIVIFDLSEFESVARAGGIVLRIFETEKSILYALPLY